MTDMELLKLAAKAAGIELKGVGGLGDGLRHLMDNSTKRIWNPLADDGDALRLAVKLKLSVDTDWYNSDACWYTEKTIVTSTESVEEESHDNDHYAATRRAIVRAAASIGKAMK